jgi:hypothetical protein
MIINLCDPNGYLTESAKIPGNDLPGAVYRQTPQGLVAWFRYENNAYRPVTIAEIEQGGDDDVAA